MNDSQISNTVSQDLAWARHHLFLLVAVAVLVVGSVYGILTVIANHDKQGFLQQQAILQQFTEQNKQVQAQTKAEIDALAQQNVVLQQQLTTITTAIATRDAQLIKDRAQIQTLPPSQLATKWGASANEPAPTIDSNGNFLASLPLAQKSTDALIQLPVLTQDKKDLQTEVDKETTVANNTQKQFDDEKKAHTSDQEVCTQTIKTKDANIKSLKADARKRNILIAIISAAFGFGLGHKY